MHRLLIFVLLGLAGCTTSRYPEQRIYDFYKSYLIALADPAPEGKMETFLEDEYISADTLHRILIIQGIYEQEILGSDYFTYTQDYAPEWVSRLRVVNVTDFMGGKLAEVDIGIEDGKTLRLGVYLKREDKRWKIYRVRDISNNYEQSIFDDNAIQKAKEYASTIE